MMFVLTLGLLCLTTCVLAPQTCGSSWKPPLVLDQRLNNHQISHLMNFRRDRCALECFLVKKCASFNYRKTSGICELSSVTVDDVGIEALGNETEFEYHDIRNWDSVIAGTCANRPCAENQRCIQTTPYICADIDCGRPPTITELTTSPDSTTVGSLASYACHDTWLTVCYYVNKEAPYYNSPTKLCNSDYSWSKNSPVCCHSRLDSCEALKECNSSYVDGHYWVYMHGEMNKKTKVYCHGMQTATDPKMYITLPSTGNIAYDAGDGGVNTPFSTVFNKIQIATNFSVFIDEYTFATSQGSDPVPYGTAASCHDARGTSTYGYFKLNTTGTGTFLNRSDNAWIAIPSGVNATAELVNLTFNGPEISGYCWGNCGLCGPTNGLTLCYSLDDDVDGSDTIDPVCQ